MRLLDIFRRPPAIASPSQLADFLDSRAAFMVQKCLFEYSRARSGVLSQKLFKEAAFREALETARWRNYPLCLRHVAVMAEHALRQAAADRAPAMREGLIAVIAEICRRYPVPQGFEPAFWEQTFEQISRRIRQAGLAAPHAIKDLPKETAREFFQSLPVHKDVRAHDFELITNNLRVNLCRAYDDFIAAADLRVLAEALIEASAARGEIAPLAQRA
jgi:hypothetical protein